MEGVFVYFTAYSFIFDLTPSSAPSILSFPSGKETLKSSLAFSWTTYITSTHTHMHLIHKYNLIFQPPDLQYRVSRVQTGVPSYRRPYHHHLRQWNVYCREESGCNIKHKNIWLADTPDLTLSLSISHSVTTKCHTQIQKPPECEHTHTHTHQPPFLRQTHIS